MADATEHTEAWQAKPWKPFQRIVFRLQTRIYVRHESCVPADEAPGLRSTPPETPSSLSPRKRVTDPAYAESK